MPKIQTSASKQKIYDLVTVIAIVCALGFPGNYVTYIGESGGMAIQYGMFLVELFVMLASSGSSILECKIVNLKQKYAILYLFIAIVFIESMLATNYPKEQFISCFRFSVTILFGIWIADRYTAEEILMLIYRAQVFFIILTIIFLIINPGLSFNRQNNDELSFVGLFTVKNSCGFELCYGLLTQFAVYTIKKREKKTISNTFIVMLIVQVALIVISKAMGALLSALIVGVYIFIWNRIQHKKGRIPIGFVYSVVSIGFLFTALTVLKILTPFILSIGKDPTLTGRTKIWEQVIAMMQDTHTMTGFGFNMFWRDESAYSLLHSFFRKDSWFSSMMFGTHNAVLELWIEIGLIGIAAYFIAVLYSFRKINKANNTQYVLICSFMLLFLFEGLTERIFTVSNFKTLCIFMLMAIGNQCSDIGAQNTSTYVRQE